MNYLQPDRLDALARSYALGTMSPRAKRRFARTLATSPEAAEAVARWRDVLGTLELGAPATMAPREAVWDEVRARLFEPAVRPAARPSTAGEPRSRTPASRGAGARGLAGQFATGLVGLLLGLVLIGAYVQWRPHALGLEPDSGAAPQAYVGVLLDAQGHAAVSTIARRHGRVLTVRALRPVAAAASEQLVVWAWNDADPTPRPVATWPHGVNTAATMELPLPAEAETLLSKMTSLGISREPAGSTPLAPSGPFVVQGACAKIW
jgi:anti-sigma-K factor RskA